MALKSNTKVASRKRERSKPEPVNPLAKRDRNMIKINADAVKSTKVKNAQKINKDLLNEMKTDNLKNYISNDTLLGRITGNTSKVTGTKETAAGITNLQVLRDTGTAFANETVSNKLRRSTEMG